jgi:sialic acid synthase SpsE
VFITQDIQKGDVLTTNNLRVIRPGYGLQPKYFQTIIGKKVNCDLKQGTPMRWDYIG